MHDFSQIFASFYDLVCAVDFEEEVMFFGVILHSISWFYMRLIYLPWLLYGLICFVEFPADLWGHDLSYMNEYLKILAFFLMFLLLQYLIQFKKMFAVTMWYRKQFNEFGPSLTWPSKVAPEKSKTADSKKND